MSDEPRRSGRATKGQHTKNQDAPEEAPKTKKTTAKRGSKKAAEPVEDDTEQNDDDNSFIRCVCGDTDEDGNGKSFIQCEQCDAWQHIPCMGLDPKVNWSKRDYFCEQCRPDQHQELLAAIAQGEKPWERKGKKGKRGKGGKPPGKQPRLSEVLSEQDEDANAQKAVLSPPIAPEDAAQPASRPPVPSVEANGDSQPTKGHRKSSQSQPLSPVSDKRRRETITEVDQREPKRRKSGAPPQPQPPPATPAQPPSNPSELPSDRRAIVDAFRKVIEPLIRSASKEGSFRIPDGETASSLSESLGTRLDSALVEHYGSSTAKEDPYFQKFLSIRFNVKKNSVLLHRLLGGSLSPDEMALMSSEDMASEEKQREYAALRVENDKQVVLIQEEGPRIRKTHKGEELIGEEPVRTTEESYFVGGSVRPREESNEKAEQPGSPMQIGSPVTVELPEDVGARRPLAVDTSATAGQGPPTGKQPSSAFDIQQVWSSVHSPDNEHHRPGSQTLRRQSSIATAQPQPQGPGDDADIDRLLKDEDGETGSYSPADYTTDPTIVWHGQINMQFVGQFEAVGRFVAGGNVSLKVPWSELVPKVAEISGRIDITRANQYVEDMRGSMTSDVAVLALTPSNGVARVEWERVFNYFHSRQRWGVIANFTHPCMRDIYIIPIDAGEQRLPSFLEMLEDSVIESPRPEPLLLLAIVARTKEIQTPQSSVPPSGPGVQSTPTPASSYPLPMQTPTVQPQFSPVVGQASTFGNSGTYGTPDTHHAGGLHQPIFGQQGTQPTPLALQILGPYITTPVVQQILSSTNNPGETILRNLKDILDRVPEARMDMNVLRQELSKDGPKPV